MLVPISEVGSLASGVGWLATCLAFCYGAAGSLTRRGRAIGVGGAIVASLLILIKVLPWVSGSFGRYEYIALGVWVVMGAALWLMRRRGE